MPARRPTRTQLRDHPSMGWLQARDEAETVPCPTCRARPGNTCVNINTGRPLGRLPAHSARMRAPAAAGAR